MTDVVKKKRPKIGMSYTDTDLPAIIMPAEQFLDRRPAILTGALENCDTKGDYIEKIVSLWGDTQRYFVIIGRYLNRAKAQLSHGEFEPMIQRELPFGQSVANRLMAVAAAIEAQIVSVDVLPLSYTTVYEIVSLTEQERASAREEGLIRPDVRREEILAFKRRIRAESQDPITEKHRILVRLRRQRERLDRQIALLEQELGVLEER